MYKESGTRTGTSFPNPLASPDQKASKGYGLQYAKAIEAQWGSVADRHSVFRRRHEIFDKNRIQLYNLPNFEQLKEKWHRKKFY